MGKNLELGLKIFSVKRLTLNGKTITNPNLNIFKRDYFIYHRTLAL
jgi:hypothetical protein